MNAKRNGKGDGFEGQSYVLRQSSIENAFLGILGISISFRNYEENYLYSRIVECFSFRTKFYLCGEQLNTEILATPKLAEHEIRTLMREKIGKFSRNVSRTNQFCTDQSTSAIHNQFLRMSFI